jgi:hypothetical protein
VKGGAEGAAGSSSNTSSNAGSDAAAEAAADSTLACARVSSGTSTVGCAQGAGMSSIASDSP